MSATLLSDLSTGTTVKASSVLQKNGKLYGPKNALQLDNESSCWNSDAGETQHYTLDFHRVVTVQELKLQFQAGFSAETCRVLAHVDKSNNSSSISSSSSSSSTNGEWMELGELETPDSLELQSFVLEDTAETSKIRLVFEGCTDFYGRVTLYQIQVWGLDDDGRIEERRPRNNAEKA
uniref:SUN domain-containing protein n=1 Tax=Cyclophora tenuis TaxID=216820 RepID=A0A7S1D4W3_CYCTE|mmetsp:Transcript_2297/g.3966  ORF Transcript_2297/g.3966 Transcript_2297/m.3966 type:complete len:178 (+) Transcript_2297:1-534(+)